MFLALAASCLSIGLAAPQDAVVASRPATNAPPLIPRSVLFGNPDRAGVQISPNGEWISYTASLDGVMNVWIMPTGGGEARPITSSTDRPIRMYGWSWNNEQILYMQDKGGDENNHVYAVNIADGAETDLTPYDGVAARMMGGHRDRPEEILVMLNERDDRHMDIHRVNTRTGVHEVVFTNDEGYVGMIPDDDWVVRCRMKMTDDGGMKVELRDSPDSEWFDFMDIPMEESMTTQPAGFSKDGQTLYMLDSTGGNTAALVAVDLAGSKAADKRVIAGDERADVSDVMSNPITGEPEAVATTYLRKKWNVLDPDVAGDLRAIGKLDDGDVEVIDRSGNDREWILAFLDDDGPVKYWHWDRDKQEGRYLFSNRSDLDGYPLVEMKPIEITARDGLVLPAYLSLPLGVEPENLPMVLFVHGGPWARDNWGYNPYHQWLANRGYAVLSVNFRGSTGFGKEFVNAGNREWAGKMQDDLTDAVEWAVAEGIADENRVAIMGGSYGGYATLVGMTFTPELYACGVDIVGPSHVRTLLETIPPYWAPMVKMFESRVGAMSEVEHLDSISPLTKVDEIQRPLLIGQGANDPRVKLSESDQIVEAMQEKDLPVTYVVFPDEGHGFRKPENNQAFNAVTEVFLARHLGGRAEPIEGSIADSSAQLRSFGELDLPGVELYVASDEPAAADDDELPIIVLEDLSEEQQGHVAQMMAQLDQVPAEMLPQVLAQMKGQFKMQKNVIPADQLPMYLYALQELERRVNGEGG